MAPRAREALLGRERQPLLVPDPRGRGLQLRRIAPHPLRVLHFAQRVGIHLRVMSERMMSSVDTTADSVRRGDDVIAPVTAGSPRDARIFDASRP
jgi:hypothetical protein